MTKTQKTTYYILLVLVSFVFLAASVPKLMSDPMAEAGFAVAHLPIWFMYFIGVAELLGVIGLWIRKLSMWAASGLFIILAGAIVVTAIFQSVSMAVFPLIVAVMLGFVVFLGKKRMHAMQAVPVTPGTPTTPTV